MSRFKVQLRGEFFVMTSQEQMLRILDNADVICHVFADLASYDIELTKDFKGYIIPRLVSMTGRPMMLRTVEEAESVTNQINAFFRDD